MDNVTGNATRTNKLRLKAAILMLFALNLVLVVLIIIEVKYIDKHEKEREKYTPKAENATMKADYRRYCFRSSERECLVRGYDLKQQNNESFCCGNSNEHQYSVMSEAISERLDFDVQKEMFVDTVKNYITQLQHDPSAVHKRPVAHVGILQNGNFTGLDSHAPRVQWERRGEVSFVSGGVIHGGDRLIVAETGFYYVYTGLQFTVNPETTKSLVVVAFLFRNVNGTRESQQKLMMSRESSCKRSRGGVTGPVSMYMAGIFLLKPEDEVSVRTPHQSLLARAPTATYLGLHMV